MCFTDAPSKHSTVKPVLTSRSLTTIFSGCFTLVLTAVLALPVAAQTRDSERAARATWQPTRNTSSSRESAKQRPLVDTAIEPASGVTQGKQAGKVRRVQHSGVPMPPADSMSIIDPPIHSHVPMDGQVYLEPMHTGGSGACDAMAVGCGCGDGFCQGGCDSMGSCGSGCCGDGCSTCGELVGGNAWRPAITLSLPQDGWVSFEYLGWVQDGMRLPPLVTTSPTGTDARNAGVLGQNTTTLFGGGDVLDDGFNGGRLRFGIWLDRCHKWGIGAEYFELESQSASFDATSSGDTILARPFFNVNPNNNGVFGAAQQDSELIAFPGIVAGNVRAVATSELVGAGFHLRNFRCCNEGCTSGVFCGCPETFCSRTEAMIGYRFLQLDESVQINETLTGIAPAGAFAIQDRFETRNQFNGLDLGWKYRRTRGFWSVDSLIRLAIGNTKQTVRINGSTTTTEVGNAPITRDGGLLAQTSNIGIYEQDEFTVIPEFGLNVGYQLTDHLRATLGYTFIYWSNVVRPGDQIDLDLNPDLLPPAVDPLTGPQRPGFEFNTTDYWVQGISVGAEYRW